MQLYPILTLYSQDPQTLVPLMAELLEGEWGALEVSSGIWLKAHGLTLHFMPTEADFYPNPKQFMLEFHLQEQSLLAELWQKIAFLKYRYQIELTVHAYDPNCSLSIVDPDGRFWKFSLTMR